MWFIKKCKVLPFGFQIRMMMPDEMGEISRRVQSYQHEFDPTPGGSGRQEGVACSGPWGHEESDTI